MIRISSPIAIYGNPDRGATKLANLALQQRYGPDTVELGTMEECSAENLIGRDWTAVFLVLEDERIVVSPDGKLVHLVPCLTVQTMWRLRMAKVPFPIHLVVAPDRFDPQDDPLTALDVLAFGLSGAAGCWEASHLLFDGGDDWMWRLLAPPQTTSGRGMLLFGRPLEALYAFYRLVASSWWPSTAEHAGRRFQDVGDVYHRYGFRVALALGLLTQKEMTIATGTRSATQTQIAERLQALQDRTGLYMGSRIVERALGTLVAGWNERLSYVDRRRANMLPVWARQEGFPAHLPLVHDCTPLDAADVLHEGLNGLRFDRAWEDDRASYMRRSISTIVTIPDVAAIKKELRIR